MFSKFNDHDYIIGERYGEFSLSKAGQECKNPVNSSTGCKLVASAVPNVQYVAANGAGHDLPYGCILDKITSKKSILYWNPNGVARSSDPNIRQVCKQKEHIYEGKYRFIYVHTRNS